MKRNFFLKVVICLLMFIVVFQLASNGSDTDVSRTHSLITQKEHERVHPPNVVHNRDVQHKTTKTNQSSLVLDISSMNNNKPHIKKIGQQEKATRDVITLNQIDHVNLLKTLLNSSKDNNNNSLTFKGNKVKLSKDINNVEIERDKNNKAAMQQIFHSGFGLSPYLSENNEKAWIENGVIYRRIVNEITNETYPAPKITDYEPFIPFNETLFFHDQNTVKNVDTSKRKIILWYRPARYTQKMPGLEPLRFCPNFPCYMTTNRKYVSSSDLLVFNGQLVGAKPPKRTFQNQLFMFHNQEPPLEKFFHQANFKKPEWLGVFNWTMTYRSDSDFPSYYGIMRKHPNPPKKDYRKILAKKKRPVAWMVSHCGSPSKRDAYVKELQKYIDVDIYGGCGKFKCDRNDDEKCSQNIADTYKFYLAFENGICSDYITEKFFRFLPKDIITVARSSENLAQHSAPEIFINTADFESPRKLAERLVYLDNNDEEYMKMLKAKDQYIYLFEEYPIRQEGGLIKFIHYHYEAVPFCQVCHRLWNLKERKYSVPDIHKWFDQKLCVSPKDI